MNFGEMTMFSREATIDVTGAPGNGAHEVILALMPRNLPAPKANNPPITSGLELLANNSLRLARTIATAQKLSIDRMGTVEVNRRKAGRTALKTATVKNDAKLKLLGAAEVEAFDKTRIALPEREYKLTGALLDIASSAIGSASAPGKPAAELTRTIVGSVGPALAAKVVPVIEVYPFYKPAIGNVYEPMRAFAVFLSHEGSTLGFKVSDISGPGITKLSTNVYKLTIPAGVKKVKVKLEAESVDPPLPVHPVPHPTHPVTPLPHPVVPIKPFKANWKLKL
jgi:hypothetical protein